MSLLQEIIFHEMKDYLTGILLNKNKQKEKPNILRLAPEIALS